MINIDDRVGSKEFLKALSPARLKRLEFADFSWYGRGPEGKRVRVGVERKTVTDLINSMVSGRLSGHQLPGLQKNYDFIYLLVEGRWRSNPQNGYLELRKKDWERLRLHRSFVGNEIYNYLNTLQIVCGIYVFRSESFTQSHRWIQATYNWWSSKGFDKHRSQLSIKKPYMGGLLTKPSTLKIMAACLPGIGHERADAVAKKFKTPFHMVHSTEAEWMEIDGIGKKTAQAVMDTIHGKRRN